jgi:hypothetical protein
MDSLVMINARLERAYHPVITPNIVRNVGSFCQDKTGGKTSPGKGIPLKAISMAFCGGGLLFEGLRKL